MRRISTCVALSALTLAACTEPAPMPVGDYCPTARRVELADLCEPGALPRLTPQGWGSCSIVTRRDAEALAAEARKWDRRCGGAK